jgi:hypothetical protein
VLIRETRRSVLLTVLLLLHFVDIEYTSNEMNNHSTKPSLELSDGEYRDDEGLLMAGKEDESWDEGRKTPLASRQRNSFALWTILLSSLVVNFSQTWWLVGDAIRHSRKAFEIGCISCSIRVTSNSGFTSCD